MLRAGIHKMLAGIVKVEDPDQTASEKQSDLGLQYIVWHLVFEI